MAEYTSKYNLYKPSRSDSLDVDTTLAENFQKIDEAIGGIEINPQSFGADPTGVNYSDSAFSQAISEANSVKGKVVFEGTYKFQSPIQLKDNVEIIGKGDSFLDGSAITTGSGYGGKRLIEAVGSKGTGTALGADSSVFSRSITVSNGSLFSAGDLISIESTDKFDPTASSSSYTKSELMKVKSVSSNTLTLVGSTMFPYTASTTTVYKITPKKNITLNNVNVVMGGVDKEQTAINFTYAENVRVINSSIDKAEDGGVYLRYVYNGWVLNNSITNCTSPDNSPSGGYSAGYGIAVMDSSRNILIDGNSFYNNRHSVTGGGTAGGYTTVSNNFCQGDLSNSLDCHEPCYYWNFIGNKVQGSSGGIISRGKFTTITGNELNDISNDAIIVRGYSFDVAEMHSFNISDNKINRANYGINVNGAKGTIKNVVISGNVLQDVVTDAFAIVTAEKVTITGNTVHKLQGRTMRIAGCFDCTISGNVFAPDSTGQVLSVYNNRRVSITGNSFSGGTYPIDVEYSQYVTIQGNTFESALLYSIYTHNSTSRVNVVGNMFSGHVANSSRPIRMVDTADVIVSGNMCHGTTGSGTDFYISGNSPNTLITNNAWKGYTGSGSTNQVVANNMII